MLEKLRDLKLNFRVIIIIAAIALAGLLTGLVVLEKTNALLNQKIKEEKEAARPADLEVIVLKDSNCGDCYDINLALDIIKKENVRIILERTVEITSQEGLSLINKFNIKMAPTFVITGEIEKDAKLKNLFSKIGEIKNDTFILRNIGAPYILTDSGDVRGRAEIIMLFDRGCSECYDVTQHKSILARFGFNRDEQIIDAASNEGKDLIKKYKIKLLPTIILKGDIDAYSVIKQIWPQVGTVEKDGTYVFREGVKQMGTYKDLTLNKIIKLENEKNE